MNPNLEKRSARYYSLSSRIASIDNKQLALLLGDQGPKQGWGMTHTIKAASSKVFVKRIPLTELEYDNLFSTANLYGMPTLYNYGVGSAGFGAFRELVAHIKTTNWVLDGSAANFPLMYHYRIIPFSGERPALDPERHNGYVKYWNSDANIDHYIRERRTAEYEIIIFLEHFPDVLQPWLAKNLDRSETIIRHMRRTLAFLREQGMIHFDVHFHNIVVGEGIPYLTDFGLVLDQSFSLSSQEREFFRKHTDYDDAEFLACLGSFLIPLYRNLTASARRRLMHRYKIGEDVDNAVLRKLLLEKIEEIYADGLMKLDDCYVKEVVTHRDLILAMDQFYRGMQSNDRKDTPYPRTKVRRSLRVTQEL